jgi:hypothetical protein
MNCVKAFRFGQAGTQKDGSSAKGIGFAVSIIMGRTQLQMGDVYGFFSLSLIESSVQILLNPLAVCCIVSNLGEENKIHRIEFNF